MKIKVNETLLEHLEKLAKLRIPETLRPKLLGDMQKILEYMELLDEIDVSNIDETYTTVENINVLRKDEIKKFENVELIKKNFPNKEGNFIKVPSIHGAKEKR